MDFHTLSRRELQALCKKNKIPANMTNLAMADALASLPLQQVEGLEDFLNPPESGSEQFMERYTYGTPAIARTATRMSTRRKPTKEQQEPESSVLSTRSTRRVPAEKAAQEFGGANLLETPAAPATCRRRAQAASARQKVEIADQESEKDKEENAPEDASIETRQIIKPPVQKVYSTRRAVRLLEKSIADLTLADKKKTIQPVKMDKLDAETAAEEVTEDVQEIKDAGKVHAMTVSDHGWEKIDSDAPSEQKQSRVPENETEVEDAMEENAGTDKFSKVSNGAAPGLSGSDPKYDDDHEACLLVSNKNETTVDFKDECVVVEDAGANSLIAVLEESAPDTPAVEDSMENSPSEGLVAEESAPVVENQFGVPSDTQAVEDSEENSPSEGLLASRNADEILSESQEGAAEAISQNGLEVLSLSENQMESSQQSECGSEYNISEPPIVSTYNLDHLAPNCHAASSMDNTVSEVSAAGKLEIQVSQYAEKEIVGDDVMGAGLTDIPVTIQTVECAYEAPTKVSLTVSEEIAAAVLEPILPWTTTTPKRILVYADSEALGDVFNMPQVEFAGKNDGLPQSLNPKSPTSSTSRMHAFSPLMAGKSSSKKQQSTLKYKVSVLDENKENKTGGTTVVRAEPNGEKSKKSDTNVDEDSISASLKDKSLRQLTKMFKEKMQIANKKSDDISKLEKVRQALQALPGNRMAVGKTEEN
ncbi:uncharacterized protein LOC116205300 isoform X3 [Punica granatum]|uniref:Uncharacterized protein LOC116205300 isoform X3 n=1 Tax=Punica granatum TaxID=22663 RepID=A0A6P8DK06_PUNGR|nr:uncharacterized protein LOC116205300 isoform X3 [Punica granatum]